MRTPDDDDDENSDDIDDFLEITNQKMQKGIKHGVQYFQQMQRLLDEDDDLREFRVNLKDFFRKICGFAESKPHLLDKIKTVEDFKAFGYPIDNEICYAGILNVINRIEISTEDNYALDEFEEYDENPAHNSREAGDDEDDRLFAQSKDSHSAGDFSMENGVTYKSPGLSAEPKISPERVTRNDYKLQAIADSKHSGRVEYASSSKDASSNMRSSTGGRRRNPAWISERRWTLSDQIGEGAFGQVYKCLDDRGKIFAVKVQKIGEGNGAQQQIKSLANEISLMRDLVHENIVQYIGCNIDEGEQVCYIFQQYCSGGSIAHVLEHMQKGKNPIYGFQERIIRNYTQQILLGLCYLHDHKIVHRDIKGGNILLDTNGVVKLADFGCSTSLNQLGETIITKQIAGSPYFMAPEVFADSNYGRRGDVWAVGCTIIQMITGKPPWREKNVNLVGLGILVQNWNEGPPPILDYSRNPLAPKVVSPSLMECLRMCFVKNKEHRPFPDAILECSFLKEDDFEDSLDYSADDVDPILEDKLEQSLSIEEQLQRASSRQHTRSGKPVSAAAGLDSDDSVSNYIERRLPQNRVSAAVAPSTPSTPSTPPHSALGGNPFASKAAALGASPVSSSNPFAAPKSAAMNRRPSPAFNVSADDDVTSPLGTINDDLTPKGPVRRGSGSKLEGASSGVASSVTSLPSVNPFSKKPPAAIASIIEAEDEHSPRASSRQSPRGVPPPNSEVVKLPAAVHPHPAASSSGHHSRNNSGEFEQVTSQEEGISINSARKNKATRFQADQQDVVAVGLRNSPRGEVHDAVAVGPRSSPRGEAKVDPSPEQAEPPEGAWLCLACGYYETAEEFFCSKCATKRGATGRRGVSAKIFRENQY